MGFFDFLHGPDINQGIKEYGGLEGAALLDVRTSQEYQEGHIPGSINIPLQSLSTADQIPAGKDAPLFVYCYSGARSAQAVRLLTGMGYTNTKNIGGIAAYKGKVEH